MGADPLAGSLTILPMILLRNPGRANGGLFARFYPQAGLLGIHTVTPDTAVSSSSDGTGLSIPVGNTGIVLGDANLIPIEVDGTVEYDPLSDVPAWPNPVSLANSAAALLFPTYLLRGITAVSLTELLDSQLKPQIAAALANARGPLALNVYLTVPVNNALPLLEPIKLPIDLINLSTGANLNNPLATVLEPALTTLTNLGYTDVKRTLVDGVPVYDRTLDQGNVITPFGSLPTGVDFGQLPGDLLIQLVAGIQKAIAGGLVSTSVVNPSGIIANLLGLNGLPGAANAVSPLSGIADVSGLASGAVKAASVATPSVATAPSARSAPKVLVDNNTDISSTTVVNDPPEVTPQPDVPSAAALTSVEEAAKRSQAQLDGDAKKAAEQLDEIAKDGQKQVDKVVKDAQDDAQSTVKTMTGEDKTADKTDSQPADGPADRASEKSAD